MSGNRGPCCGSPIGSTSGNPGPWMKRLAEDEYWVGAPGTLVVECEKGHRWGTWPEAIGKRCIEDVGEDSRYVNGLCGYELKA